MANRKNILTHGRKRKAIGLYRLGRFSEARDLLASVCERERTDTEAWLVRGAACGKLGEHAEAARCFGHITTVQPCNAEAFYNLGVAERSRGATDRAEQAFRRAVAIHPNYPEAYESLAHILLGRGALGEGADALRSALALRPDNPQWHVNLGATLQAQGMLGEAISYYERARALSPGTAIASENLGSALASQGRTQEAVDVYREGLRLNPKDARARSNLLLTLNYLDDQDSAKLFAEHRSWDDETYGGAEQTFSTFANARQPERRLRIGYISPDFRRHSVAYFIEPILTAHDHQAFEIYCYADVAQPDATTERIRRRADHWRPIAGLSDTDVLRCIRADQIDILVDLSGHTSGHRLTIFARRAVPVQVTYLGYPNTTGLVNMDYRITDAIADPPDEDRYYTEKLIRLDGCFLCYQPPAEAPATNAPAATGAGHITFGSFNNLAKIQPNVIKVWAQLLGEVPASRLLIKNPSFNDPTARSRFLSTFEGYGIEQNRIELLGLAPSQAEHLRLYDRVDIALDTFPYNGTTTTCEALWMGVPVITFAGRTHASRVGASLLNAAGLEACVADSPDDYVARAKMFASDVAALTTLRANLRTQVQQSRLCDAASATKTLEAAMRAIWRDWCMQAAAVR